MGGGEAVPESAASQEVSPEGFRAAGGGVVYGHEDAVQNLPNQQRGGEGRWGMVELLTSQFASSATSRPPVLSYCSIVKVLIGHGIPFPPHS